jgi:hypothetical protein
MNPADLVAILLAVVALFVIVKGFRLPGDFQKKEAQRMLMRKRLMELEFAKKAEEEERKPEAPQQKAP